MNSLTTLESNAGNLKMPCDSDAKLEKKLTNKFDVGMLANLTEFFGHTYIWWWWPTVPATTYTGQGFAQVMPPNPMETLDFLRGKSNEETPEERIMKPRSIAEVDVDSIFMIAENFTQDKHMQFYNRMLEVGKRRDNTFGKREEFLGGERGVQNGSTSSQEKEQITDLNGEGCNGKEQGRDAEPIHAVSL